MDRSGMIAMMSTLSLLMAQEFVITTTSSFVMTTSSATIVDKVGILTTVSF